MQTFITLSKIEYYINQSLFSLQFHFHKNYEVDLAQETSKGINYCQIVFVLVLYMLLDELRITRRIRHAHDLPMQYAAE